MPKEFEKLLWWNRVLCLKVEVWGGSHEMNYCCWELNNVIFCIFWNHLEKRDHIWSKCATVMHRWPGICRVVNVEIIIWCVVTLKRRQSNSPWTWNGILPLFHLHLKNDPHPLPERTNRRTAGLRRCCSRFFFTIYTTICIRLRFISRNVSRKFWVSLEFDGSIGDVNREEVFQLKIRGQKKQ